VVRAPLFDRRFDGEVMGASVPKYRTTIVQSVLVPWEFKLGSHQMAGVSPIINNLNESYLQVELGERTT